MKKLYCLKSLLFSLILVATCLLSSCNNKKANPSLANNDILIDKYSNSTAKKLLDILNELSITEDDPLSSENLIGVSGFLFEKAGDFTDNDLISIIDDEKYTLITKVTLIQLSENFNDGKGIIDQKPFEKYISQTSLDQAIRINLIESFDMGSAENKNRLEKIVKLEEGAIVVRSLYSIERNEPKKALMIANQIIDDYKKYSDDAIRAAVKIKSHYFEALKLAESKKDIGMEKENYIKFCISRYDESKNEELKDTMVFSLIDIQDFNAVKAVFNHAGIDEMLKQVV